jgi:hypothetical protein
VVVEIKQVPMVMAEKASKQEIWQSVKEGSWALLLPVIIVGGFRSGVFTPTEAGAVAAFYSLLVALFVYREMKFKDLFEVLFAAAETTAIVMLLVAASAVSAFLITIAEVPLMVVDLMQPLVDSPTLLLLAIMLFHHDRRHGDGPDAYGADSGASADAAGQGGRHQPGLFRRAVHSELLDWPDHAAGGQCIERDYRCVPSCRLNNVSRECCPIWRRCWPCCFCSRCSPCTDSCSAQMDIMSRVPLIFSFDIYQGVCSHRNGCVCKLCLYL